MEKPIEGITPVLSTPFTDSGDEVDVAALRREVEFVLDAGATGISLFGMASEVVSLTLDEKVAMCRAAVDAVPAGTHVIAGSGSTSLTTAREISRALVEAGATMLVVVPPHWVKADEQRLWDYFAGLASDLPVPLMVQDAPGATGVKMTLQMVERLATLPTVVAIKVEDPPVLAKISKIVESGTEIATVGGMNGVYLVEEFARGAAASFASAQFPEMAVRVWQLCRDGNYPEAQRVFSPYLPVLRYGTQPGIAYAIHKEILRLRGVFDNHTVRNPATPIGEVEAAELWRLMAHLPEFSEK